MRAYPAKRGFAYPLKAEDGGLKLSEDLDLIRESIFEVLETRWFERVMRPSYGIPEYVFTAVQNVDVVAEQIRQALETQVRDVDSFRVTGEITDDGVMRLDIDYTISKVSQPSIRYLLKYD
ncbi:MAG TPA: GPW/gp25 family protein [Vampirovibrionales bacterium]